MSNHERIRQEIKKMNNVAEVYCYPHRALAKYNRGSERWEVFWGDDSGPPAFAAESDHILACFEAWHDGVHTVILGQRRKENE